MCCTWLLSQWGEKYQVMFIVPKKDQVQKQKQKELAMMEVGFAVCNDGSRVRKFAMPGCGNRLK